jgi:hypothetical protein
MVSVRPEIGPETVAHTCNPRYSGVRYRKIVVQSKQKQKSYQDLISKTKVDVLEHTYNHSNKED